MLGGILLYAFALIGSQESSALALRTLFDHSKITRITARIENVLPDRETRALVVIGSLGLDRERLVRYPERRYLPALSREAYVKYRQVEITNFFLGYRALESPTQEQVDRAIEDLAGRAVWPAAEAVFLSGDAVVVALDPYTPGVSITRSRSR